MLDKIFSRDKALEKKVCKKCGGEFEYADAEKNYMICPGCDTYFRMTPKERIALVCDSFKEKDKDLKSKNILSFPGYDEKLESAYKASGCNDAVTYGIAETNGIKYVIFVMNSYFMMGSMGRVVGEKISRAFELAASKNLPVVGFTTSGGARMQEGIFSLMQMAKVSGAVKRHKDKGLLYITVLTDPTTGGVTASFAMEGDIILAEPKALIGFAGARVIEQTTGEKLPEGFQRAEFLLKHGFVDKIVPRQKLKNTLADILTLHNC